MNAKWPCPDGTYNDEEGKSTEGDCKTCNGMINDDKTACGACPAGKKSDGAGGCGDCPEFEYPDGADACKSYGEILSKQLDDIYAAAKQDIPNYSSLTCTTSNKYEGIMSDKISDKSKLETPWGKPIRVRGGSDCGCVDIYIMNLDKKNCEHLVGLNDSFKSKAIWCSGYSIKANHGDRPCSDDDANEVRFYYKPW
jgi:hypothetical protein